MVLSAISNDAVIKIAVRRIGPVLVFERLWEETGCRVVIDLIRTGMDYCGRLCCEGRWWAPCYARLRIATSQYICG
jgi:hypothetical protein